MNGFDVCFSTESKVPTWDPLFRPKGNNSRQWWDPVMAASDANPYGTAYWNEHGESVTENTRGANSRVIMDRAIPFIQKATQARQPFFSIIWFHTPHLPVVAGPRFMAMYKDHPKYAQHYYGCITAMDEQVGRLRSELRKLGAAENTLLFFCSDNAPEGQTGKAPGSAGHLSGRKRSLLEGGIRVPGLVEWPARIKPGRTTNVPCVTSDYLPTILALLDVEPITDRPIDGISLVPLFDGKLAKRGRPIGFESKGQTAWIGDRYKLYFSGKAKGAPQLFDLIADPSEKQDLAKRDPAWPSDWPRSWPSGGNRAAPVPPATIIDVRRRRPKRRWLRWLLLLIVIDAAAFLLVVEQPGGAPLQRHHSRRSGGVRRGVRTDQGGHLAGESLRRKGGGPGRRDRADAVDGTGRVRVGRRTRRARLRACTFTIRAPTS